MEDGLYVLTIHFQHMNTGIIVSNNYFNNILSALQEAAMVLLLL